MKTLVTIFTIAAALSTPVFAADQEPDGAEVESSTMECCKKGEEKKTAMQESMLEMRQLMAEIKQEQDLEKRQQLMQQHMATMRREIAMMNEVPDDKPSMKMGERLTMMEDRMGMMQLMMEQVLEHSSQAID